MEMKVCMCMTSKHLFAAPTQSSVLLSALYFTVQNRSMHVPQIGNCCSTQIIAVVRKVLLSTLHVQVMARILIAIESLLHSNIILNASCSVAHVLIIM